MADNISPDSRHEILRNTAPANVRMPDRLPFWAEFPPERVAAIILRRAGIAIVSRQEDRAMAGLVGREPIPNRTDVTVTYSPNRPS